MAIGTPVYVTSQSQAIRLGCAQLTNVVNCSRNVPVGAFDHATGWGARLCAGLKNGRNTRDQLKIAAAV